MGAEISDLSAMADLLLRAAARSAFAASFASAKTYIDAVTGEFATD